MVSPRTSQRLLSLTRSRRKGNSINPGFCNSALGIEAGTGPWLKPAQYERKARPPGNALYTLYTLYTLNLILYILYNIQPKTHACSIACYVNNHILYIT